MEMKFDWNDIAIVPAAISQISSRNEINPFRSDNQLPIFASPMDTVINQENANDFALLGINVCLPRGIEFNGSNTHLFYSYGLDEIDSLIKDKKLLPKRVLIDVANGNMKRLMDISSLIKKNYDYVELMVGNIANPETYREYCKIGVDWVRVGIGGGSACTTSANVSIHYPMASLINECHEISKEFSNPTKIIADGGFKSYSDIIKALALGADAVMLGGVLNKCLESCGDNYLLSTEDQSDPKYIKIDLEKAIEYYDNGIDVYKYYRGMSTKEVQKAWNKSTLKTGEGISKYNKVDYKLSGWIENFKDYLKSAMSYTNSLKLDDFIGKAQWVKISQNSFNRFNK